MKAWYVTKAGRLSNGFGLDNGRVNHIVISEKPLPPGSQANALCGTYPKVSWGFKSHEKPTGKVCARCLAKRSEKKHIEVFENELKEAGVWRGHPSEEERE